MQYPWRLVPFFVLIAVLVIVWQILAVRAGNPHFPSASSVASALVDQAPIIASQLGLTLVRCLVALLVAIALMIPLGILIGRVRWLGMICGPLIEMLRPLPPPAIAPLVLLFGGNGEGSKIFMIAFAASFPILVHTIDGVRGLHPMYSTVARACRLTLLERMLQVDLPAALPVMVTGIRLAISTTFLVSIIAEILLSSDGMGIYLLRSQQFYRIDYGIAACIVLAVAGWAINTFFLAIDRRLMAWHYATTGDGR